MDTEPYTIESLGLFSEKVIGPGIDRTFTYYEDDNDNMGKEFCEGLNLAYQEGYAQCFGEWNG